MRFYSGLSHTPEYAAFKAILSRCTDPNNPRYKDWGGRGITVDPKWDAIEKIHAFIAEVGYRPSPKHSINRKDNDAGYVSGNMCWSTAREQCRNRRNNKWYEYDGKKMCLQELAETYKIRKQTIKYRVEVLGWTLDKTLTTPTVKSPNFEMPDNARPTRMAITWNGQSLNSRQWAAITGISDSVIRGRLRHGWAIEDALTHPV
jgi:hypothetical protein